jgi:hypothetical protein
MFNYIKHTEMNTAEPPVPEPSSPEAEIANELFNLSPDTDQNPAELIKSRGQYYIPRYTNLFIVFGVRKNRPYDEQTLLCT